MYKPYLNSIYIDIKGKQIRKAQLICNYFLIDI